MWDRSAAAPHLAMGDTGVAVSPPVSRVVQLGPITFAADERASDHPLRPKSDTAGCVTRLLMPPFIAIAATALPAAASERATAGTGSAQSYVSELASGVIATTCIPARHVVSSSGGARSSATARQTAALCEVSRRARCHGQSAPHVGDGS